MDEWEIIEKIEHYPWTDWKAFPDPRKREYLTAPFGAGVYQLRNKQSFEYILFGKGKHLAERMTSLLPKPFGCGTRNNDFKREYVLKNLENIEYRTVSLITEEDMQICEDLLKKKKLHKFNS